jgi:hypothetical protein
VADFPKTPFEKGVVTAIYNGPDSLSELLLQLNAAKIKMLPEKIPRGSLIVRRVTRGADVAGSSFTLCFPFFSSHLQLPVKPTEMVWVIFDGDNSNLGYWLSRVHGDETAEDLNFSHFDRGIDPPKDDETLADKLEIAPPPQIPDDFPNISLAKVSGSNSYDIILSGAIKSLPLTRLEPVPRYIKRPGDLVIHGSNNAAIALTTDRGWASIDTPEKSPTSVSSRNPNDFSGTVDIVTGRSRWIQNAEIEKRTVPPFRVNRRKFVEVSKRFEDFDGTLPVEGDADFLDDAARVYVSQRTGVDFNFGTSNFTPTTFEGQALTDASGAAVGVKADQLRLIARKDEVHGINGSIRIIKEGNKSDDLAAITILPDGTIQISGRQVHIGRHSSDGGAGDGDPEAPGSTQPYILYAQLESLLRATMADIRSFCDTVLTHTTPGYGAPSPQLNTAANALKAAMDARESQIPSIRSKRIFGE